MGIHVSTTVSLDVRETTGTVIWEAAPGGATPNRRSARLVLQSYDVGPDLIYVHGESLETIAAWFEQVATDIRRARERQAT